ncbi:MAG TPA: hypothetical protein VIN74_05520 [Candidatus Limnocylindria bacterium]
MRVRKRYVALGLLMIAIVSLVVVGSIQGTQQRELMDRSFVTLGRFPDAVAVYTLHEDRQIIETYVTAHTADEIRAYYDLRLHEMSWQGPGPEWTEGDLTMRCYGDPTGRLAAKLGTRAVPQTNSFAYSIQMTRDGCTQRTS